jgi:hypothetical protein
MNGRAWTQDELDRVRELYPVTPTKLTALELKRCISQVYSKAHKLGLEKAPSFLESPESGRLHKGQCRPGMRATQFPKGHVPANKGLRRPGWGPGRMKTTQFQKGTRAGAAARNWVPVGTIKVGNCPRSRPRYSHFESSEVSQERTHISCQKLRPHPHLTPLRGSPLDESYTTYLTAHPRSRKVAAAFALPSSVAWSPTPK